MNTRYLFKTTVKIKSGLTVHFMIVMTDTQNWPTLIEKCEHCHFLEEVVI